MKKIRKNEKHAKQRKMKEIKDGWKTKNQIELIKFLRLFFILFAFTLFFFFCFFTTFVKAAKIYGEIYGINLQKIDAFVKINSTPEQKALFSKNYSFEVSLGEYVIEAFYKEEDILYYTVEKIVVPYEGEFRVDLILIEPELEEEIYVNDTELDKILEILDILQVKKFNYTFIILFVCITLVIVIALVVIIILLIYKKRKKKLQEKLQKKKLKKFEELKKRSKAKVRKEIKVGEKIKEKAKIEELLRTPDVLKKQVIETLEKEKRMLQKDLRKKFNVSEAKISLLITELEAEGKIKKIKRGRANILVWQE